MDTTVFLYQGGVVYRNDTLELISLGSADMVTGPKFLLDQTDEMAGFKRQGIFSRTNYTL